MDNPAFVPSSPGQPRRDRPREEPRLGPAVSVPSVSVSASSVRLEAEEEGPCGWGRFAPAPLQRCNNPRGYLLHYSLLALVQGIVVNGLVNISISTIEKRYELNSSLTGLVSSSYDISFCVLSLFVSFYGERGHKPRWLAFSSFMIGLGSLVFCLPHFTTGAYEYGSKFEDTCPAPVNSSSQNKCSGSITSSLSSYLYVFVLGQLMLGVGGTPLYTLGTAFIDDSVAIHKSSLYIGIGYAMSILGPAIGYVLGGQLLTLYIDINRSTRTDINEDDPRWLGAWWIAFLLSWILAWSLIVPFSCFPKHLPGTAMIQAAKVSQTHQDRSVTMVTDENFGESFKDFPMALLILLKNPVFVSLVISTTTEALITTGFATFLPKFIENQFGKSSSTAATLGGLVLIPGAALGQVLGGAIASKSKMNCQNVMKFALASSAMSLLLSFVFLFAKCGNEPFAGVSEAYNGTGKLGKLEAPCNANCSCLRSFYYPVCGKDDVQYFSPCTAGCTNQITSDHQRMYYNCSCVGKADPVLESAENETYEAKAGKCETKCKNLPLFLGFFFFTVVFTFMAATPITVAVLRCVPDKQRSFALGVQFVFLRLLGTIPGPILFGAAIDSSCTLWDLNNCGMRGACWIYDNTKMAYMLIGISAACKVITLCFNGLALFVYRPPPKKDNATASQPGEVDPTKAPRQEQPPTG
ncbi:solute carrier organic anion transporter family member 4C1 [Tachyglossus aculeatus]|uniref:solute carrier organic anion transporter family member 4C1 n=1 Tax=Tachyglossus aculeatus TaxID=9261 RepID=UPI0018F55B10|nr:solute carrier organic anion transporter family member 4C1 [Tachyglossus aculeatus]